MALFAIGDTHLSLSANKPMDVFGGGWTGYVDKLSAGFRALVAPEDTVVIAGMGGDLTARILDAAPWVREYHTRLLLQPMTKPDHLREYLCREGFRLELENAVISGKFVYTVFSAVYDGIPRELSLLERYIGRVLDGDSADTDRKSVV